MTARSWAEVVAAVPHDKECNIAWGTRDGRNFKTHCTCTRDARIGAGIAAGLHKATEMAAYGAAENLTDAEVEG
jgi:hypothetical protein